MLFASATQPTFAMCMGDLLAPYLQSPRAETKSIPALANVQLALIKIIAVHPDALQSSPYYVTGTLAVTEMGSTGKLPENFAIRYQQRIKEGYDCQTWDGVSLIPGKRLLAFLRPENEGWSVPIMPAAGVVTDTENLPEGTLQEAQKLFQQRSQIKKLTAAGASSLSTRQSAAQR